MQWLRFFGIAVVVLGLFAGGIAFDIFVVQHFTKEGKAEVVAATKKPIQINQDFQVKQEVKPSILQMSLEIMDANALSITPTLTEQQRNQITQKLDSIIKLTQANKTICQHKPYAFGPRTSGVGQERGYFARLNVNCKMNESEYKQYEDYIAQIKKIVHEDEWLDFKINAFEFLPTEAEQAAQEKILRELAIKQANELVSEYGQNLKAKCAIGSLSFGQSSLPYRDNYYVSSSRALGKALDISVQNIAADSQNITLSLHTNLMIACEN